MKIEHDENARRFYARFGEYEASLMYARQGDVLDFYHIYVPDPHRNRGVAARVLIAAFEYAKQNKFRVVPTCPFIAGDFLPRFPRFHDVVEPGEFPFV